MRHHLLLLLSLPIIACAVIACGDDNPPHAGEANHVCRHGWLGWAGWCDEGLACIDNTCVPCGFEGQPCCNDDVYICHTGLACDEPPDEVGTCTAGCGSVGLACCTGDTCPASGTCNDGKCDSGATGDSCVSGSTPYVVYIVGADCTYTSVTLSTDTIEQAQACRQQIIDGSTGTIEVSELDGAPPTLTSVCRAGESFAYSFWHYGDSQLQACEQYYCASCSWTLADANGSCR